MDPDRSRISWAGQYPRTVIYPATEHTPAFFIPKTPLAEQEARYAELAAACQCSALPLHERIYAVEWVHNGIEWTGTVGKHLTGIRRIKAARGKRARIEQAADGAMVRAIFPGFQVTTDGAYGAQWSNPFFAGVPQSVTLFGTASPPEPDLRGEAARIERPAVKVYRWRVAYGLLPPPNVKGTREAIAKIPGSMVDYDSVEQIDPALLDAGGLYTPKV